MKLEFLGTGAADFDISKRDDYKEFRRFSSVLINDDLLIDPGPHIFDYVEKSGQASLLDNVKYIIVTHSHGDHFNEDSVKKLFDISPRITLYGDPILKERLVAKYAELENIRFESPEMFKSLAIGGYDITPLYGNHTLVPFEDVTRHYYIVERESGKRLFYGVDSGWLTANEWAFLKKKKCHAMVFELTIGEAWADDRIFSHTGIPMLKIMLDTVRHQMAIESGGRIYTTHMARTLHHDHATLIEQLRPLNVTPAYDGMKIEI